METARATSENQSRPGPAAGFTLIEVMVAMLVAGIAMLGAARLLQVSMTTSVRAREDVRASRLADAVHARMLNADFLGIVPRAPFARTDPAFRNELNKRFCDTSKPGFALPANSRVPRGAIEGLHRQLQAAGFSHFTIDVEYLRRDSANNNANAGGGRRSVTDFIAVDLRRDGDDANGRPKFVDRNDPNVKVQDLNNNREYSFATDPSGRILVEMPDTHLKRLKIEIWKNGRPVISKQGEVISQEKFSGVEGISSESPLKFLFLDPRNRRVLAEVETDVQDRAFNLTPIRFLMPDGNPYPGARAINDLISGNISNRRVIPIRQGVLSFSVGLPIRLAGQTETLGTVEFELGTPPVEGGGPYDRTTSSAQDGSFVVNAREVTRKILERTRAPDRFGDYGEGLKHVVYGWVKKNGKTSPYASNEYNLDINPPTVSDLFPGNGDVAASLTPYIACRFLDTSLQTPLPPPARPWATGILVDSISTYYSVNGGPRVLLTTTTMTEAANYDASLPPSPTAGIVKWRDLAKKLPPKFPNGARVEVTMEGCDNAHYVVQQSWTFQVSIDPNDPSAPLVSAVQPIPALRELRWTLSDPESGINAESIQVIINGVTDNVGQGTRGPIGNFFDPQTGTLRYPLPPGVLPSGSVEVKVEHWGRGAPGGLPFVGSSTPTGAPDFYNVTPPS